MNDGTTQALTLSERIKEALDFKVLFTLHLGNLAIPIDETVVVTWGIMAVLIVGSLLLTRRMTEIPKGPQVLVETLVGGLNDFFREQIGHHWKVFAPWLGTVALYLGFANLIAMVSPVPGFGFEPPFTIKPPTRDINVTAALAVSTILIVVVSAVSYKGMGGWLRSFLRPVPFMLPFNVLEYAIKPLSLCLRLFGNVLGAFIIMEILENLVPLFVPPVASLYFDIFDGLIQAVVFVYLSTLYITEAVE